MSEATQQTLVSSAKVCAKMWWLGLLESMKVHRCIVLFVLDKSNTIAPHVLKSFVLNGCVFLGSIVWWNWVLYPTITWLLTRSVQPLWGSFVSTGIDLFLKCFFTCFWLIPAYAVTLMVSSIWYQKVASAGFEVSQQESGGTGAKKRVQSGSHKVGDVAQELYRAIFTMVFYMEVWIVGQVPFVGKPVYFLFSCWLYAYYCYDYRWSLLNMKLPDRFECFERNWAFFAGFGTVMTLATLIFSFYVGAAILAVLFPLFILVACNSEPAAMQGTSQVQHFKVPIFATAVWATDRVVNILFGLHTKSM